MVVPLNLAESVAWKSTRWNVRLPTVQWSAAYCGSNQKQRLTQRDNVVIRQTHSLVSPLFAALELWFRVIRTILVFVNWRGELLQIVGESECLHDSPRSVPQSDPSANFSELGGGLIYIDMDIVLKRNV